MKYIWRYSCSYIHVNNQEWYEETLSPLPQIEADGRKIKEGDKMYDINTWKGYILIIYYDDNMIKPNARQENVFQKQVNSIRKIKHAYSEQFSMCYV